MSKNNFEKRLSNVPAKVWSKIAKIDELKGRWTGGARLSPQVLGRLKRSVLVTSSGASTRIEGAKLTDEEIENLMKNIKVKKFIDRDSQEVKGYYELLQNVFDSWKNIRFSENTMKHFHKELLKYVGKDERHRGEYKKTENRVEIVDQGGKRVGIIFETTPAYLTPKKMQELTDWTQKAFEEKKYHPLLIIGNFIVDFLKIHPFQDGNGRISRVLTNLLLLKEGYLYIPYVSHEKLVEDNKNDYYISLRKSQKTLGTKNEDIVHWLSFFLDILLEQSEKAISLFESEDIEKLMSEKQIAVWRYLEKIEEASPKEIAYRTKVARPTVNQILNKLLEFKKIERIGMGRSIRYRKL